MIFFYKILNGLTPKYLFDTIPVSNDSCYNTRAQSKAELTQFYTKIKSFSNTFFPFCIKEWNQFDAKIRNLPSVSGFKKSLLIYFKTDEKSIFYVHNPIGTKLLKRLRLHFSHLNEHKFRHNFRDTFNPFCLCNAETETINHYLLRFPLFSEQRTKLLESLSNLDNASLNCCYDNIVNILSYGSCKYSFSTNNKILSLTVEFLESTKRFDKMLF